jgi:hypothetical protein
MEEPIGLGLGDPQSPGGQLTVGEGGQAVPGDHDVGLADRDRLLPTDLGPVRRLRQQVPDRGVHHPGLDRGHDHVAVGLVGVQVPDVVPELGGLGDAIPHVPAALGVVHGAGLVGDGGAHHAAAEPVQQAQVEPPLLVELCRGLVRIRRAIHRAAGS